MGYLNALDDTKPTDTDYLSRGDDHIRDTRQAMDDSFIGEHWLNGEHRFPYGDIAQRPAAGNHPGRLYFRPGKGVDKETAGGWDSAGLLAPRSGFLQWNLSNLGYASSPAVGWPTQVPVGARVLALFEVEFWALASTANFTTIRITDASTPGMLVIPGIGRQLDFDSITNSGFVMLCSLPLTAPTTVALKIDVMTQPSGDAGTSAYAESHYVMMLV